MKRSIIVLALAGTLAAQVPAQSKGTSLKTEKEKISYSIGVDLGKNFKIQAINVDPEILLKGFKDGYGDKKTLLSDSVMQATVMKFQQEMMMKQQATQSQASEKNKREGAAFLAENKKKTDVVTTASGLQYKVLKMGTGPKPSATQTVSAHYRGTLLNGKEFDSSYKRGQPTEFPLNQVIKGWTEGLQLMPVGSKFQFWVPSDLGYGDRGTGADIGPGATLMFEVELISIK